MTTQTLYFRNGDEFTGTRYQTNDKGKPFVVQYDPCSRCGGAGGWVGWPGFTCFRCGGKNSMRFERSERKLYTAEQLAKLNATAAKRNEGKERKAKEEKEAAQAKIAGMLAEFPEEIQAALKWATEGENVDEACNSIAYRFFEFGTLTEPQRNLLVKRHGFALEKARQEAEAIDCPSGRLVITGAIVSVKWVENNFGGAYKMLVRDDRGFKVYGTCPSSLGSSDRGDRVEFTATVEPSRDDKLFGFFSRPSKARNL